jgi:hypothetical protein
MDDFLDFLESVLLGAVICFLVIGFVFITCEIVNRADLINTEKKIEMLQEKNLLTNETIDILIKEIQI